MSQKLDREKTVALVKKAVRAHKKEDVDLDDKLGTLIPSEEGRKQFRVTVHGLIRSQGFEIELHTIPIHREVKVGEIVHTLMSALPGQTPIPKPDQKRPKPPAPKTKSQNKLVESDIKNEEEMS